MAFRHRIGWYVPISVVLAAMIPAAAATVAFPEPVPPYVSPISALARTIIPAPVFRVAGEGAFMLDAHSAVDARGAAAPLAEYLVNLLRPMTGLSLPLSGRGNIVLIVEPGHTRGGYDLHVAPDEIWIAANTPEGLFDGVQTLRQLMPPKTPTTTGYAIAATTITDYPRYTYRGAMLDVARHFFGVTDVKRYIDDIAMLKMNVLHLHLTDDQGWRIAINGWPRLTAVGGSRQVGGGAGGYYTQSQYREIVAYAASRYITIVPEIDMPGHTNAALASYAELNCSGSARSLYFGMSVGFSSLCTKNPVTWSFVKDVITQLAAMTPGPWIHLGGDESSATSLPEYISFINRVGAIVASTGKTMIGWHDIGYGTALPPGTIGEYWDYITPRGGSYVLTQNILNAGGKLIMAPSNAAYLDQKYDLGDVLGTQWAEAPLTLQEAYGWDPAAIFPSHAADSVLGVEAPLWTETIKTMADIEFMAFPRIVAIAEVGWSQQSARNFTDFVRRLATLGDYLHAQGIAFRRIPGVAWH
ncbi:MAG: beta-N-acetylhexosaminidase [Terrimesophilobacter sp.]